MLRPELPASRQLASGSQSCVRIHGSHSCTTSSRRAPSRARPLCQYGRCAHRRRPGRRARCVHVRVTRQCVSGAMVSRRHDLRSQAGRTGSAGTVGVACRRVVSRARTRNRVSRVGRRQNDPRDVGDMHSSRMSGAVAAEGKEIPLSVSRRRLRGRWHRTRGAAAASAADHRSAA